MVDNAISFPLLERDSPAGLENAPMLPSRERLRHRQNGPTRSPRRGVAAVEFAIVAIPFFIMIFACIEFARVGMIESMAEDAAFQAARDAMVIGSVKAEARAEATSVLAVMGVKSASVDIHAEEADGTAQAELTDDTALIRVTVRIPMSANSLWLGMFTNDVVLEKTCTVTAERYKGYYDGQSP